LQISANAKEFPLAKPFGISRGHKSTAQVLEVVVTKDGLKGFGEAVPYGRYEDSIHLALEQLETVPEDVNHENLRDFLPAGAARNALDLAYLDLFSKNQSMPVWDILHLPAPHPLAFGATVSLGPTQQMIEDAKSKANESILKIKLGGDDDLRAIKGIREVAAETKLLIDVNEGWSFSQLQEYMPTLIEVRVEAIEQPTPAAEDSVLEQFHSPIPLCADESLSPSTDIESLKNRYQIINFKLDKSGGLTTMIEQIHLARTLGFGVMVGCMVSSSLAIAPAFYAAQLADFVDLDGFTHLANDREDSMQVTDGFMNADKTIWGKP
jgi:L-alanine-DL-glutamate epimerase-like enolase superfamily enzyme